MKKIICIFAAVILLLSMTACGTDAVSSAAEETTLHAAQQPESMAADYALTAKWLQEKVPEPSMGAVGGEWLVLGLARSDVEGLEEYFEAYGERVAACTAQQGGVLHGKKYTEYSRVILAWTAIGRDAADVGGFDLLVPLADFEQTVFQGINGPIFALLALDSGNYEIPESMVNSTQATRDMYVDYILSAELPDGGWSLAGGAAETDITAMALQALAKYCDRKDAAEAVERGLAVLSEQQNSNGGYTSYDAESSESIAQTIVALTELGISLEDPRFVKNGNTLLDALLRFRLEDGSFSHLMDGEADLLATEQAFYALVALHRTEQGKPSLYRMKQA